MSLLGADVSSGEPLGDEADLLLLKSADKMIVIIENQTANRQNNLYYIPTTLPRR